MMLNENFDRRLIHTIFLLLLIQTKKRGDDKPVVLARHETELLTYLPYHRSQQIQ